MTIQNDRDSQQIENILNYSKWLVDNDETELALKVLDCLPGYYRDNTPDQLSFIKKDINKRIMTVHDYITNTGDDIKRDIHFYIDALPRGLIIKDEIKKANAQGIKPHICDVGAGDYWMVAGLDAHKVDFTYNTMSLHRDSYQEAKQRFEHVWCARDVSDRPNWFVAYELIEHLHNVHDLFTFSNKICSGEPEKIFLSTPKYCYGEGAKGWEYGKRPIQHLRTYTPREFMNAVHDIFKGYNWYYYDDAVMVLIGEKN